MNTKFRTTALVAFALTALGACSTVLGIEDIVPGPGGSEAGTDAPNDTGVDAPNDTGVDAPRDVGVDAPNDAGADSSDAADAGVAIPPSCAPGGSGMTNCGASQESCCTSLEVPGGSFFRTYTYAADGGGPNGPADPATVGGFQLDKYHVTVGRFRQFVQAVRPQDGGAGWMPAPGSGKHVHLNGGSGLVNAVASADAGVVYETGWTSAYDSLVAPTDANLQTSTYTPGPCTWTPSANGGQENLPVNCVTWQEAYAFCIWDGGFIPSLAEWEYAAAGGNEQRQYAWGETPPGIASQYAIYGCYYPSGAGTCSGVGTLANIAPVGTATLGVGKWGQLDLNGELAQFALDYAVGGPPLPSPCTDCTYQKPGGLIRYAFRGGGFDANPPVPSYGPNNDWPARSFFIGFRCARRPQ